MNIKIPIAKFIHNEEEEEIKAMDITSRELYKNKYRGKLYCKEDGCKARLQHVDSRASRGKMFFRTNAGNNPHKDRCPSEVLYNGVTTYITSNGEAVEVADEHIKGTINRRIKKHNEKTNGKKGVTIDGNIKRNTKRGIPSRPAEAKGTVTPSLNGQGRSVSDNEKGTRISGKEANQIAENDFGKPRCIDGYVKGVYIYENYAQIQFRDICEYEVFIEFGEAFKENNISAYNRLDLIKKYVHYMIEKEEDIYCVCVGLVQKRHNKVIVEVYKEIEFVIEERSIIQFTLMNDELLNKI